MRTRWDNALSFLASDAPVMDRAAVANDLELYLNKLEQALRDILKVDWERGTDWDTNTIMRSYLDAAVRMQEIARSSLQDEPKGER